MASDFGGHIGFNSAHDESDKYLVSINNYQL